MTAVRPTLGVLVACALTGCAGEQLSTGSSAPSPAPLDASMTGRWTLSAPNAPSCGLEFGGGTGSRSGSVMPDGGCPGNFYTSRRWAMEAGILTIADDDNQSLAQFKPGGARFDGQSTSGMPVSLAR